MDEHIEEMLRLKKNLAHRALESGDLKSAWNHLTQALATLSTNLTTPAYDRAYASASLELADLSFAMGKGFDELIIILQKALPASERLGNRRFHAMVNLHLARLRCFSGQQPKAMDAFVLGKKEVEELGDEDILDQAAEFIGLYYLIQGLLHESLQYFERAAQSFESKRWGRIMNPSGPMWLSLCFAYLGQFHRAIGTLAYYRGLAADRGDKALANTLESVLGIVLTLANKKKEAEYHLSNALLEARKISNAMAEYFSFGGFAFLHYQEGRIREAKASIEKAIALGSASGLIFQYTTPTVIELLFEIECRSIAPSTKITFHGELNRILEEPSLHLRGVALRLKARKAAIKGEDPLMVDTDLRLSEKYLIRSGDPIQLGKTRLEMARQELSRGDMENARAKARKAWSGLSAEAEAFFPDDLKHLLPDKRYKTATEDTGKVSLETFAAMIQELAPTMDVDELLTRTITATNRFFGAERGGIFWFTDKGAPILRAACNLSQGDVQAQAFRTSLSLIIKTRKENQPHMARYADTADRPPGLKAALCVPIEASGGVRGVLYHDNSFLKDSFDHYEKDQLVHISQTLNSYIEKILRFGQNLEKKAMDTLSHMTAQVSYDIITQNSGMLKILDQADLIAETDSTVLITGKTGAGKELLARRIHKSSARRDKPFVILDPMSVPETLIESELFGHEKGAFTGADRQRKGRMELAHNGTLFIDEVGEIPKSSQVKFLRVLQEKTLVRLGGTRNIKSDFRLIAATNRDLSKEVAEGNFREDLFYRLNVIPIELPPLRERADDIPLLAEHFLAQYAAKYNRSATVLSPEDKKLLMAYDWPGNVREFQNVIERAVLLSAGGQLEWNLPGESTELPSQVSDDILPLDEIQHRYIRHVLAHTKGKINGPTGAAHLLGMKPSTLYHRMKKLGIRH